MWTEWKLCSIVWFMVVWESLVGVDRKKVFIWRDLPDSPIVESARLTRQFVLVMSCHVETSASMSKHLLAIVCAAFVVLSSYKNDCQLH